MSGAGALQTREGEFGANRWMFALRSAAQDRWMSWAALPTLAQTGFGPSRWMLGLRSAGPDRWMSDRRRSSYLS